MCKVHKIVKKETAGDVDDGEDGDGRLIKMKWKAEKSFISVDNSHNNENGKMEKFISQLKLEL